MTDIEKILKRAGIKTTPNRFLRWIFSGLTEVRIDYTEQIKKDDFMVILLEKNVYKKPTKVENYSLNQLVYLINIKEETLKLIKNYNPKNQPKITLSSFSVKGIELSVTIDYVDNQGYGKSVNNETIEYSYRNEEFIPTFKKDIFTE